MRKRFIRCARTLCLLYLVYGETGFATTLLLFFVWTTLEIQEWAIDAVYEEVKKLKHDSSSW